MIIKSLDPLRAKKTFINQSRTNGPINAHLTIAQVMPRYNHNNEKLEALLKKFRQNICSSTAINSTT